MRLQFAWDPVKAAANVRKHGVPFDRAMEIFADQLALSQPDPDSRDEERWVTIGQTGLGQLLVVVHTYREFDWDGAEVRIISARPATRREARQFAEGR